MRGEGISLRLHTSEVCLRACSKALLDSKRSEFFPSCLLSKECPGTVWCCLWPVASVLHPVSKPPHTLDSKDNLCLWITERSQLQKWKSDLGISKLVLCRTSEKPIWNWLKTTYARPGRHTHSVRASILDSGQRKSNTMMIGKSKPKKKKKGTLKKHFWVH